MISSCGSGAGLCWWLPLPSQPPLPPPAASPPHLPPSPSPAGLLPAVRSCQIQPSCAGRGLGSIPAGEGPGCELMVRVPEVAGKRLGWRRGRRSSRKRSSGCLLASQPPAAHAGLRLGQSQLRMGAPGSNLGMAFVSRVLAGLHTRAGRSSPCAVCSVHPILSAHSHPESSWKRLPALSVCPAEAQAPLPCGIGRSAGNASHSSGGDCVLFLIYIPGVVPQVGDCSS